VRGSMGTPVTRCTPRIEPYDMGSTLECRCGRCLVSNLNVDAEIIRPIVPQARCTRLYSVGSPNHRWQRLIGDLKLLSRILGLTDGLGHDESDRLADKRA